MARFGGNSKIFGLLALIVWSFALASVIVSADRGLKHEGFHSSNNVTDEFESTHLFKVVNFLWQSEQSGYQHIWPEMVLNWKIIVATMTGFVGAAFGSVGGVGGVGGGGIFVPMLMLIIGFDPKSATAVSKCMIMAEAVSTVFYNLKLRHPTLDMPIVDYDLALLIQPMLMLGISIGVALNVLFADWMVTVLLVVLFLGSSRKAVLRGIHTWERETILEKDAANLREDNGNGGEDAEYKLLPGGSNNRTENERSSLREVPILENVCWKEFGLLCFVWIAFLAVQISKNYTANCSTAYWVLNLLQIPVSVGVCFYEASSLYTGRRVIASSGEHGSNLKVRQLLVYCFVGVLAGVVGGLLGLGAGFLISPLFLEIGIPPQVSGATTTLLMLFSSSMSVVEYYLLDRFPISYALYFVVVATIAALVGQHIVRRVIVIIGRASIIIFILASTVFISAIAIGHIGVMNMISMMERNEYMGFENLCKYRA